MSEPAPTTWDGLPASKVKPYGAAIVVYRKKDGEVEFLLLHRAHHGPDYMGDWAWTPPSGCRFPDEPIETCARRELMEEAGLDLPLKFLEREDNDWMVYIAEASADMPVNLIDKEHDKYKWVNAEDALLHAEPAILKDQLQAAINYIPREA
jgi:8-oxo-dGTP pyrophosphatase MutT (NUDIX family)